MDGSKRYLFNAHCTGNQLHFGRNRDGSITLTLSVTNSCGNTITDTVVVNVSPTVTPTFNPITVCAGASDPLQPLHNSITGTWSPAFNNAATATYAFTPNAGQCASTTTLTNGHAFGHAYF
jgi:hypothetical protein